MYSIWWQTTTIHPIIFYVRLHFCRCIRFTNILIKVVRWRWFSLWIRHAVEQSIQDTWSRLTFVARFWVTQVKTCSSWCMKTFYLITTLTGSTRKATSSLILVRTRQIRDRWYMNLETWFELLISYQWQASLYAWWFQLLFCRAMQKNADSDETNDLPSWQIQDNSLICK